MKKILNNGITGNINGGKVDNKLSDIIPVRKELVTLKPFVLKNETSLKHSISRLISTNESEMNKILRNNPEVAEENPDTYACGKYNTLYLQNIELKKIRDGKI